MAPQKVAVIGAGWAGMAAAIAHRQAGRQVTVFEAARTVGGRARAVPGALPDGTAATLDNGQHILIGAYTESLRLMRLVGVDPTTALLRLPLTLQFPDGQGLQLPDLAPPLDALLGIVRAKGWGWQDKVALLRTATAWQLRGFRCAPHTSVADLCAPLTPRLMAEFIEPLCVSALNTPAREASGQVFLRVLQDSLFSGRGGSNLLLPRTDLGALFPEAAMRWLVQQGGQVVTGQRIQRLVPLPSGRWQLAGTGGAAQGSEATDAFDHITLACPSWEAARLVDGLATAAGLAAAARWSATAGALRFEAITTVYAHASGARLPLPMLALRNTAEHPAQFVFDRGQLDGHQGLLAFVMSASDGDRALIEQQVLQQAAAQLGLPGLRPVQTVVEKRATFACTPGLQRPAMQVLPGLTACGDYVDGPYPATLEGAVLSGTAVAACAAAG
ncbi:squalene-associated FAD-dependent desaturase [Acidovorax delafieldii]|uniref:Squalene-associated FAD-dependent desaturase n=1 Tax=Acidovorax delafieldii TaxID=47920 RepID=A0AAJ2F2D2_ACIDE|nr:hydroxysqualene dehydroxylase HpnE [Acidovorax delafieldii]MDR6767564.1 squalene-associated FAD-dependent desaturase [Acidovorax delafieldii]MDR6838786.1 squalene-associated FAD-dependent desaturase [Acidovorax delafieldii]MDR7368553.1 squalene-associated FAD-dependent desaturase [Acidovorax delafieldii]